MEIKDIRQLIALMQEGDLLELEIVGKDGGKVRLRRRFEGGRDTVVAIPASLATATAAAAAVAAAGGRREASGSGAAPPVEAGADQGTAAAAPKAGAEVVRSSMVGTFYRAPSPESPPFVEIGDEVEPESTVCIIEAMKVFNEIKAGVAGVITEALVENGEAVEYGMPLFTVKVTG
ncbi:MAG: acetyl-CoA carboxylase biotin carboxyl carrier protein [Planctomycetes bacterium]|nr:acetyl-CoA carboxylase biotin carboxyl carrier protein [Planctomycetota bacterium]